MADVQEEPREPRRTRNAGAAMHNIEDELDLRSWLTSLGGEQDILIRLLRKEPRNFRGVQIEGSIATFTEFIDEEIIKDRFGGGLYQLVINQRDPKDGRVKYKTAKTIRIAGLPKIEEYEPSGAPPTNGGGGMSSDATALASRAMDFMQQEARAAKAEARQSGMDPVILQTIVAPMRDQIQQLASAIEAKDRQILQLMTEPMKRSETPTVQDRMFEKMIDGESARIESIRTQHDSEMRQLKSIHQAELDRERARLADDMNRREKQHDRELEALRDSQKFAVDALKTTYETRIDSLKSEIARLQSEAVAVKVEIGELKAKKEKSLPEQAQEIVKMQEALKEIGIGGKEEDEDAGKSVLERIAGRLLENPEAIGQLVGGVRGATAPSPEQVQAEQLAAQQHQARLIAAKRKAKKQRAAQIQASQNPAAATQAAPGEPVNPLAGLSANEVGLAIKFMDSAIHNGTSPEAFAAGARSAIPADILRAIEKTGVDEFLAGVELPQDSHLRTQRGRVWVRAVAEVLLQGTAG